MNPEPQGPTEASRRTALVVASNRAEREAIVAALREERMRVSEASEPYEAFSLFVRDPAKLVVFSLHGSRRRDAACLRQMGWASPGVRILLVVPEGHRRDASAFLEAGGDSLVSSPFYADEMRLLARSLLRSDAADPLTGLPNREAGERAQDREMSRARREGTTLGFALLDIDRFKKVNMKYGFRAANGVLRAVARRLRDEFRITDIVARWGGEEFVVLLSGLPSNAEEARRRACDKLNLVRKAIEALRIRLPKGDEITVTLSGGLCLYLHEPVFEALPLQKHAHALFDTANERLSRAKEGGRNLIVCGDGRCPNREPGKTSTTS